MPRRRPFRRLVAALSAPFQGGPLNEVQSRSSDHSARALTRAAGIASQAILNGYGIEALEQRVLFTVLGNNAPLPIPQNGPLPAATGPGTGQVDFFNLSGTQIRIAWNDMEFQVVDATVPMGSASGVEADPDVLTATAPTLVPNIYAIYIMQSHLDSWLSIGAVPAITDTTDDRPFLPTGSNPTLNVFPATIQEGSTAGLIAAPIGTGVGSVLLGAVTTTTTDAGLPILSIPNTQSSTGPFNPGGNITPGVYESPVALDTSGTPILDSAGREIPNDLGRFLFGGVITGDVNIPAPSSAIDIAPEPASQGGNVGLFYAGAILTGDAEGTAPDPGIAASSLAPNFSVGGDIRDLVTTGNIGGGRGNGGRADLSQYFTGLRMVVGGSVGEINMRGGGFYGSLDVEHLPSVYGLPNNLFSEHELEARVQTNPEEPGDFFGPNGGGQLATLTGYPLLPATIFNNDASPTSVSSTNTAQFLGSVAETNPDTGLPIRDANGNIVYYATVDGVVEGDAPDSETTDNYAIPLLAGQTIDPELTLTESSVFQGATLSLIDPDGRVVANETVTSSQTQPVGSKTTAFQYTADRPGVYTFRIVQLIIASTITDVFYNLTVTGLGDLGLGALSAGGGDIIDTGAATSFEVQHGDAGAFLAPTAFAIASTANNLGTLQDKIQEAPAIQVDAGSLRVVKGGQLGVAEGGVSPVPEGPFGFNGEFGAEPVLSVPAGQVGLLEATDLTGVLTALTPFDSLNSANVTAQAFTVPRIAIGGNIQMIDGAGTVFLDLATNQGIGDILAGNMATTTTASFIETNFDNVGNDGIIDLIDVSGNFGSEQVGGPAFITNTGGYLRFLHVGGQIFQDTFFGNQNSFIIQGTPNQVLSYTEDTGTTVKFTPVGSSTTTTVNDNGVVTSTTTGPTISLTTYGIRDKGGGVIVNAAVGGGTMTISASGGNGIPADDLADISGVSLAATSDTVISTQENALGAPVLNGNNEPVLVATQTPATAGTTTTTTGTDANNNPVTTTVTTSGGGTTSSLTFAGNTEIDVLDLSISGSLIDNIANNTPNGEIANIDLLTPGASIVSLSSIGTIGLLSSHTGAVVTTSTGLGTAPLFPDADTFPFDLQSTGIYAGGDILNIRSGGGLGNISVDGSINSIVADAGASSTAGVFAGINGPVIAGTAVSATTNAPEAIAVTTGGVGFATSGNIDAVNVGQGVLPSGTGSFALAGIFADGDIGSVTNAGRAQADVRGNVIAADKLDAVTLTNASIIGATVGSVYPLANTQSLTGLISNSINEGQSPINFTVGAVTVNGRGGIIGSIIFGFNINRVSVGTLGFGILTSTFESTGGGVINSITAGGYGLRDSDFVGGRGHQLRQRHRQRLAVARHRLRHRRPPERHHGGSTPSPGSRSRPTTTSMPPWATSPGVAVIPASTDTGVLEDDTIASIGTIGSISAQTVRTAEPITSLNETEPQANIPRVGQTLSDGVQHHQQARRGQHPRLDQRPADHRRVAGHLPRERRRQPAGHLGRGNHPEPGHHRQLRAADHRPGQRGDHPRLVHPGDRPGRHHPEPDHRRKPERHRHRQRGHPAHDGAGERGGQHHGAGSERRTDAGHPAHRRGAQRRFADHRRARGVDHRQRRAGRQHRQDHRQRLSAGTGSGRGSRPRQRAGVGGRRDRHARQADRQRQHHRRPHRGRRSDEHAGHRRRVQPEHHQRPDHRGRADLHRHAGRRERLGRHHRQRVHPQLHRPRWQRGIRLHHREPAQLHRPLYHPGRDRVWLCSATSARSTELGRAAWTSAATSVTAPTRPASSKAAANGSTSAGRCWATRPSSRSPARSTCWRSTATSPPARSMSAHPLTKLTLAAGPNAGGNVTQS